MCPDSVVYRISGFTRLKGGLLKTSSRETTLFEEPTYLGYRNAVSRK
jgi:hypothetical protein